MKVGSTGESKKVETPLAGRGRNDNSNPQQGTGGSNNKMTTLPSAAEPIAKNVSAKVNGKPPPTKKDSRKLFVGGLPADVTDREFREFFSQYGAVLDSVVMYDRETHRSRGFGFVTFEDPDVAARLLKSGQSANEKANLGEQPRVGRLVMRGKTCEVKAAEPKETRAPRRPFVAAGGGGHANGTRHEAQGHRPFKMFPPEEAPPPIATMAGIPHSTAGYPFPLMAHEMNGIVPVMAPSFYHPQGFNGGNMPHMSYPVQPPVPHGVLNPHQPGVAAPLIGAQVDGPVIYSVDVASVDGHHPAHLPNPNYWIAPMPQPHIPQPHAVHPMYLNNYMQIAGSVGMPVMQSSTPGIPIKEDNEINNGPTPASSS